jgi:hypothetical protein
VIWRRTLVTVVVMTVIASPACADPQETGVVVSGVALAGPVCPVETNPPDPKCAPRPVIGATLLAIEDSGEEVASTTDANGEFSFVLAPGHYNIVAQPADGLMGIPPPIEIDVAAAAIDLGVLMYDTGIR